MRDARPGVRWSRGRVRYRALYGSYMESAEWFRRRQRWVEQFRAAHNGQDPVCAVCGEPWTLRRGDLHHRSYVRLGAEASRDLVPLCRAHHDALHLVLEHGRAWRGLGREQATDQIVAYLRGKVAAQ